MHYIVRCLKCVFFLACCILQIVMSIAGYEFSGKYKTDGNIILEFDAYDNWYV